MVSSSFPFSHNVLKGLTLNYTFSTFHDPKEIPYEKPLQKKEKINADDQNIVIL